MNKLLSLFFIGMLFLSESLAITFTDSKNYWHTYSLQAITIIQKHKVASAACCAAALALLITYKPFKLLYKAYRINNLNPKNSDEIITTISRTPYPISRTKKILEFAISQEEYIGKSIMGLIIFEHDQFLEKQMFSSDNMKPVLNYRRANIQFEKENSLWGKLLTQLHLL